MSPLAEKIFQTLVVDPHQAYNLWNKNFLHRCQVWNDVLELAFDHQNQKMNSEQWATMISWLNDLPLIRHPNFGQKASIKNWDIPWSFRWAVFNRAPPNVRLSMCQWAVDNKQVWDDERWSPYYLHLLCENLGLLYLPALQKSLYWEEEVPSLFPSKEAFSHHVLSRRLCEQWDRMLIVVPSTMWNKSMSLVVNALLEKGALPNLYALQQRIVLESTVGFCDSDSKRKKVM